MKNAKALQAFVDTYNRQNYPLKRAPKRHVCVVNTCTKRIPVRYPTCREHAKLIPSTLQRDLYFGKGSWSYKKIVKKVGSVVSSVLKTKGL
jgi:hypothetical protein